MNRLATIALISGSLTAAAWSADAGRYPIRQIDRPLILPKKMWQERLSQNAYLEKVGEPWSRHSFGALGNHPEGFMPNLPAYSFTDNLLWMAVPAPLFRYLITRNNITAENGPVVKDFSMTLDGGILAYTYSPRGTTMLSTWGASVKKPMLDWLWLEGSTASVFDYSELLGTGASAGLGFQLTDRTYLTSGYSLNYLVDDPDDANGSGNILSDDDSSGLYHGVALGVGFNFSPHISLGLHGRMVVGERKTVLNPGAELSFQW